MNNWDSKFKLYKSLISPMPDTVGIGELCYEDLLKIMQVLFLQNLALIGKNYPGYFARQETCLKLTLEMFKLQKLLK